MPLEPNGHVDEQPRPFGKQEIDPFIRYCLDRKYFCIQHRVHSGGSNAGNNGGTGNAGSSNSFTHWLMSKYNNGKMCIPDSEADKFYAKYAECIIGGCKIYCTEKRSLRSRVYFDLDMECLERKDLSDDLLIRMISQLIKTVLTFYAPSNTEASDNGDGDNGDADAGASGVRVFICHTTVRYPPAAQAQAPVQQSAQPAAQAKAAAQPVQAQAPKQPVKIGLRVIFNNLRASDSELQILRQTVIYDWIMTFGHPKYSSYDKMVDFSVMRSKGSLRMLGSRKIEPCRECKGNDHSNSDTNSDGNSINAANIVCDQCGGYRQVDVGRIYQIWHVWTWNFNKQSQSWVQDKHCQPQQAAGDLVKHYASNFTSLILETRIRMDDAADEEFHFDSSKWELARNIKLDFVRTCSTSSGTAGGSDDTKIVKVFLPSLGRYDVVSQTEAKALRVKHSDSAASGRLIQFDSTDPRARAIATFINDFMNEHYKHLNVRFASVNERKTWYRVEITGPNDRWCENIGNYHKSVRVNFLVKPSGMTQHCHCQCLELTGRQSGIYCAKYASTKVKLTDSLKQVLFPDPRVEFEQNLLQETLVCNGEACGESDNGGSEAKVSDCKIGDVVCGDGEASDASDSDDDGDDEARGQSKQTKAYIKMLTSVIGSLFENVEKFDQAHPIHWKLSTNSSAAGGAGGASASGAGGAGGGRSKNRVIIMPLDHNSNSDDDISTDANAKIKTKKKTTAKRQRVK